ncbi:MAG: GH25 family lysozyme [Nostoc sp.]|uniref:GH25 family lysozyme n=1 Tax=Nostoc sp. TaxID=1180 RepID=UPI002FF77481
MKILKLGDSGSEVEQLQNQLKQLGFDIGIVDGQFGQKTKLAVEKFQKEKGLTVDGIAGDVTLEELFNPSQKPLILGIDVASIDVNESSINWQAVKKGNISFAFIKATEGGDWPSNPPDNKWFENNWPKMKQAGLIRGAYHFFQPLTNVEAQVQNFLKKVKLELSDLPPALDVEDYPPQVAERWGQINLNERINRITQWLQTVEKEIGRRPTIYTNPNFWKNFMNETEEFTDYSLWLANYDVVKPTIPANNWGGKGYTIWQNTQRGAVNGISGDVDQNRFNGSLEQLIAFVNSTKVA